MAVHVFASATHDFYFNSVSLPDALRPLLNTDGQGIIYLPMPQKQFFESVRFGAALPGDLTLGVPSSAFMPLAHARPDTNFSTGKGANPAAICGMFGLKPTLYCALGVDPYSKQCVRELTELGVIVQADIIPGMTMAHAHVFVEDTATQLSLIYKGTNNLARHDLVPDAALNDETTLLINTSVPLKETRALLQRAEQNGVPRVVFNCTKAVDLKRDDFAVVTDIVINRDEAEALCRHFGLLYDRDSDQSIAMTLAQELGARCVMTRNERSVIIAHDGQLDEVFPNPVKVVNVTGAGDGFLGVYLAGIDQGKPIVQTVKEAVVVGGLIAAHEGPRLHGLTQHHVTAQAMAIRTAPTQYLYGSEPAEARLRA